MALEHHSSPDPSTGSSAPPLVGVTAAQTSLWQVAVNGRTARTMDVGSLSRGENHSGKTGTGVVTGSLPPVRVTWEPCQESPLPKSQHTRCHNSNS